VATRSLGPAAIISDGATGWLVERDDRPGLISALTEVVQDPAERRRRGELARVVARERYSWTAASESLASVLIDVCGGAGGRPGPAAGSPRLVPLPTAP
jgi:glycosyltransferase involved in cell wall biosynthesis